MEEERVLIKYLQDIVDLETRRRIAGNTYNRLLIAEKNNAYVRNVSDNEWQSSPGVAKQIKWGSLIGGLLWWGYLFLLVAALGALLIKWTMVIFTGGFIPEDVAEIIAGLMAFFSLIMWGVWYIKKEVGRAQQRVETERESLIKYKNDVITGRRILAQVQKEKPVLKNVYNQSGETLKRLYALNIIYPKYQNLEACGMFLQYLEAGRTHSLEQRGGDAGAYNLYENDLKFGVIKSQLNQVLKNQQVLYGVLTEINSNVESLCSSVERIEKYSQETSQNTKISAWCNAATAANTYAMRRMQDEYFLYRR